MEELIQVMTEMTVEQWIWCGACLLILLNGIFAVKELFSDKPYEIKEAETVGDLFIMIGRISFWIVASPICLVFAILMVIDEGIGKIASIKLTRR